jgi:hypothetical protein
LDLITERWFDENKVTVNREASLKEFMSDAQIVRLTGAPACSTIFVTSDAGAIEFKVENDIFQEPMYRYLFQNDDGSFSFYLKNAVLVLVEDLTDEGIGPRCVIHEIYEAKSWTQFGIPIAHIEVSAVGDYSSFVLQKNPLRGYYVWATMGFDGDVPPAVTMRLNEEYKSCKRIVELVSSESGRAEWQRCGETVDLAFDLQDGSPSWNQLNLYMTYKGIEI